MKRNASIGCKCSPWQVAALAGWLLVTCSVAWAAGPGQQVRFHIAAQPLGPALIEFSDQAQVQVLSQAVDVSHVRSQGLDGLMRVQDGLTRLLKGTGFSFASVDAKTYVIRRASANAARDGQTLPDMQVAPAKAGPATASSAVKLETVKVVGRSRTAELQTVPSSVEVIGSHVLTAMHAVDLSAALRYSANVRSDGSPLGGDVKIRGIGAGSSVVGFTSRVGIYVDGVYVGQPAAFNQGTLGVQSIEVLRGPQGTIFGQNTEAGAINIVTKKPTHYFTGSVKIGVGNFKSRVGQAFLSGPLADGVYGNIYLSRSQRDGYVRNVLSDWALGAYRRRMVRAKIEFDNIPEWKLLLSVDHTVNHSRGSEINHAISGPFGVLPNQEVDPHDYFVTSLNVDNHDEQRVEGISLRATRALPGGGTARSTTAYRDTKYTDIFDVDYSGIDGAWAQYLYRYKQFTEGLQLQSASSDVFEYTLGLYFLNMQSMDHRVVPLGDALPFVPPGTHLTPHLRGETHMISGSIYGNATYHFNSRWKLQGGVRVTHLSNKAHFDIDTSDVPELGLATGTYADRRSVNEVMPALTLTYRLQPHSRIYVRAAKGYKTGGFNMDFIPAANFPDHLTFGPEQSIDYELGFKGTFMDGRLRMNADAFHTVFHGFQVGRLLHTENSGIYALTNAGTAQTSGAEFSGALLIGDGIRVDASLGYARAVFAKYPNATSDGADYTGHWLKRAPRFSGSVGMEWEQSLGSGGFSGDMSLKYSYRTAYYTSAENIKTMELAGEIFRYGYSPARGLLDFSYAVTSPNGDWQVSLWARNLTNKTYIRDYGQDFFDTYVAKVGEPRMAGVSVTLKF